MRTPHDRRKLEQQRDALLAGLRGLGNLMRGTIGEVGVKCGRPGCACTQGVKHRKVHLSGNLHGRTRSCYLGREREALVLLLAAGGDCLDDIAVLQADGGLGRLLGRRLPSADTLRHFLSACHADALLLQAQAARPCGRSRPLSRLRRVRAPPSASPPAG